MPVERARRAIPLVLAWVAAAVIAVAVASWGVALVGQSVTEDRPAALAAAEVEERLSEAAATTPVSTTTTTVTTTTTTTTTTPPAGETTTTLPTSAPATTIAAPVTTAPPPTAAPPTAPAGETRTYTLVGGTASLRFDPSGVTVAFANPAQGFDVQIDPDHGNGVKIEFESDAHESRLDAWWDDGPQDRKEERPDGG